MYLQKFITLLLTSFCLTFQSQDFYNNLVVKTDDSSQFIIAINNFQQNFQPHNNIKISNIKGQSITLTIHTTDSIKQKVEKQLFFESNGKETISKLILKGDHYKFRFISEVNIEQALVDTAQLLITYNEDHKYENIPLVTIKDSLALYNDSSLNQQDTSIENSISYKGKTGCNELAGSSQSIIELLNKEIFSENKLKLAKKEIQKNCFLSNDISRIINLFEFDDLKLDLAKFSYDFTFDIDNYHLIIELLDFDSSKKSLTDYINNL